MLIGALFAIVLSFSGEHLLTVLLMLYALAVLLWLASWPLRKKQAGDLLLRVGANAQTKVAFFVGLLEVGVAIVLTFNQLDLFTGSLATTSGIITSISRLSFWWTLAIFFLAVGQSNLEIHEYGLTYFFTWQPWERIVAFGWDDDKPNTLILRAKQRTIISRKYITLSVPTGQVEDVDRLLEDYLLEADLAAEMDGEISSKV